MAVRMRSRRLGAKRRAYRDLRPLVAFVVRSRSRGRAAAPGRELRRRSVVLRLALADPARVRTLTLVDSAGLGREVNPLLALDTLPIIGELAIMISRMSTASGGVSATTR